MAYEINIDEEKKLIYIISTGAVTNDSMRNALQEAKMYKAMSGINKLILDATGQEEMPSMSSIFFIVDEFPDDIKIAIIFKSGQSTEDEIKFMVDAALKRGKNIQVFLTKDEACNWLNQK